MKELFYGVIQYFIETRITATNKKKKKRINKHTKLFNCNELMYKIGNFRITLEIRINSITEELK